jgi:hypothetical protein
LKKDKTKKEKRKEKKEKREKKEKKRKKKKKGNFLTNVQHAVMYCALSELPIVQPIDHCLDTISCRLFLCTQAAPFHSCQVVHRFCTFSLVYLSQLYLFLIRLVCASVIYQYPAYVRYPSSQLVPLLQCLVAHCSAIAFADECWWKTPEAFVPVAFLSALSVLHFPSSLEPCLNYAAPRRIELQKTRLKRNEPQRQRLKRMEQQKTRLKRIETHRQGLKRIQPQKTMPLMEDQTAKDTPHKDRNAKTRPQKNRTAKDTPPTDQTAKTRPQKDRTAKDKASNG